MIKINLSPVASDKRTEIEVNGDTLIYDGVSYDFSPIKEGYEVEGQSPAIGTITRVGGVVEITLQYQYDSNDNKEEERFPANPYSVEGVFNV